MYGNAGANLGQRPARGGERQLGDVAHTHGLPGAHPRVQAGVVALATHLVKPRDHAFRPRGSIRKRVCRRVDALGTGIKRGARCLGRGNQGACLWRGSRPSVRRGKAVLLAHLYQAPSHAACRGRNGKPLRARLVRSKNLLLKRLACLRAHLVHCREAHACALVHLHLKRDGLEGALPHATHVLDKVLPGHSLGAGRLHHKALCRGSGTPVRTGKRHRERLAQARPHAHGDGAAARHVQPRDTRRGVHRRLRANHAHHRASRDGPRSAAGDGLASSGRALGAHGEELGGILHRPQLEQVALPHRLVKANLHVRAGETPHALAPAVRAAASHQCVLQLAGRDDLAHQLAAVVGALVAHHLVAGAAPEVGVREVAVEDATQRAVARSVGARVLLATGVKRVERTAVGRDHGVHVVWRLHAALDLERGHARVGKLGKVINNAIVLGAERPRAAGGLDCVALLVHQVVRQAARLRAEAAVGRAPAGKRAHHAHAGIAEAQGPVAKGLKLHALLRNGAHLVER